MKKIISLLLAAVLVVGLTACGGNDDPPQVIIDCVIDPTGEGCPVIEPEDTRTVEEILADAVIETWDGELTHLDIILDNLDFSNSMQQVTEFNLELVDDMEETHFANGILTDSFQYLSTGTIMSREIVINLDGETQFIEVIYEEVDSGVVVYINIASIKASIVEEDPEILEVLNTLGVTEDWLMFRFDDTLANIVELEVIKDMLFDIFFLEYGETFFYDLQSELDLELGILLSTYGVNIGAFVNHIVNDEYDDAELLLENIDFETMILDLDMIHLVPEIVILLQENQTELDLAGFDTAGRIAYILANGTEALLNDLNDGEIEVLIDVLVDANQEPDTPDFSDLYAAYISEELDHYFVMAWLNDPQTEMDLSEIPGFDFAGFKATMDTLDYDAFYLEEVDFNLVIDAALQGQTVFDAFVLALDATAPQTANILVNFSGSVLELEDATIMPFLNDPDVEADLRELPGFDFDAFKAAVDVIDRYALYLEDMDIELLLEAVYNGQEAFDAFLADNVATYPQTVSLLAPFSGTVLELEIVKAIVDDVNYAIDNLTMFETYFDMQYYLDNDILEIEIEKTLDFEIQTTATLDGSEASQLFVDVLADAYTYMDGFETFEMPYVEYLNCPILEQPDIVCEEFPDYLEAIDFFNSMGYVEMTSLYNPSSPNELTTEVDFTDFVNALIALDDENGGVINDLSITLTVREEATINIPASPSNVNQVAQDFARVSLNFMTYDFVRNALEYYQDNPTEFSVGNHALDSYGDYMNPSLAFDANMSFITIGGSLINPTISCTLYWADGTLVFVTPVTLSYLDGAMLDGMPTHAQYLEMLANVDPDNFNMSKLLIIFVFSEFDNGYEEEEYYPE